MRVRIYWRIIISMLWMKRIREDLWMFWDRMMMNRRKRRKSRMR